MTETLSQLFVPPHFIHGGRGWANQCAALEAAVSANLTEAEEVYNDSTCEWSSTAGFFVLLAHMVVYGGILYAAAELIGDGSELLLLIPRARGIVGSVILPVLGAIPDAMIVLFSALGESGPAAQEKLAVGMGALSGSTVMLLTIPWFASILSGRVDIDPDSNECRYRKHNVFYRGEWRQRKLGNHRGRKALFLSGVEAEGVVRVGGYIMVITSLTYLAIQIPAFIAYSWTEDAKTIDLEEEFALGGGIFSFIAFGGYIAYSFVLSRDDHPGDNIAEVVAEAHYDHVREVVLKMGKLDIISAFVEELAAAEEVDLDHQAILNQRVSAFTDSVDIEMSGGAHPPPPADQQGHPSLNTPTTTTPRRKFSTSMNAKKTLGRLFSRASRKDRGQPPLHEQPPQPPSARADDSAGRSTEQQAVHANLKVKSLITRFFSKYAHAHRCISPNDLPALLSDLGITLDSYLLDYEVAYLLKHSKGDDEGFITWDAFAQRMPSFIREYGALRTVARTRLSSGSERPVVEQTTPAHGSAHFTRSFVSTDAANGGGDAGKHKLPPKRRRSLRDIAKADGLSSDNASSEPVLLSPPSIPREIECMGFLRTIKEIRT